MIDGFSLRRGDSYSWSLTFDDGASPAVPIDLSGKTLTFTVKASYDDADTAALVQVSTTFPDDADSQAGKGTLFVPHTATAALVPGQKVYYDFQLAYTVNDRLIVTTLDAGTFKVSWDVTRSVPA